MVQCLHLLVWNQHLFCYTIFSSWQPSVSTPLFWTILVDLNPTTSFTILSYFFFATYSNPLSSLLGLTAAVISACLYDSIIISNQCCLSLSLCLLTYKNVMQWIMYLLHVMHVCKLKENISSVLFEELIIDVTLTAIHWITMRGPQVTVNWNSGKRCTACSCKMV